MSTPEPAPPDPIVQPSAPPPEPPAAPAPPVAPPAPDAREKAESAYGEPISPSTIKRFPHLQPFIGHILIGGKTAQAVLAGISPGEDDLARWQPAGIAFFIRDGSDWRRLESIGALDLKRETKDGKPFRATGVDVGVDFERGIAFASFVYAGGTAPRMIASYRLEGERLSIEFGLFRATDRLDAGASPWSFRFRGLGINQLTGPVENLGPMRGSTYTIRYRADDVSAVIGLRPFDIDDSFAELTLSPARSSASRPVLEGVELLLGRRAAALALVREAEIRTCAMQVIGGARAEIFRTPDACAAEPPLGRVDVRVAPDDVGGRAVPYPVYLFDADGRARLYTALFAGETLEAAMPAASPVQLADTRSGRIMAGLSPWTPDAAKKAEISLPVRASGRVRLSGGAHSGPAILTLNRLDQPRGDSALIEVVTTESVTRISPNVFIVRAWPIELRLLSGGYAAEIATGEKGTFCSLRLKVSDGRPQEYECAKSNYVTAIPNIEAARQLDLAAQISLNEAPLWRDALGVSLISINEPSTDARAVFTLTVRDKNSGMALMATPATKELRDAWEEQPASKSESPLPSFAEFVKARGNGAILEMSCPVDGMSPFEYEHLVVMTKPHALRLFGCAHGSAQYDWLDAAGRIVKKIGAAPMLTAISSIDGVKVGGFFPRLTLDAQPSGWQDAVRQGRYSLSAGALVGISGVGKGAGNRLTLKIDIATTSEIRARYLMIFTERGLLTRKALDPRASTTQSQTVEVSLPQGAEWLRVEVRGTARRAAVSQLFDRGAGVLLATTNFIPARAR